VEYISEKKLPDKLWRRPVAWNVGGMAFYALYTDIFSALSLAFVFTEMAARGADLYVTLIEGVVAGIGIAIVTVVAYLMTRSLGNGNIKNN
jgi:hypothetical protein